MQMEMGKTIARLRREKGITQEQLAKAVGVSAPAVSKWETGQSYPDITLLPPLARFFGVTLDALVAYAPALTDAERDALTEGASEVFARDGYDAGIARCEALMREYPDDAALKLALFFTLEQGAVFAVTEEQRTAQREKGEEWLKEALEQAKDTTRLYVEHTLGILYLKKQRLDEAERLLTPFLDLRFSARTLMPTLRMLQERYDEAETLDQHTLLEAAGDAASALMSLAHLSVKQGDIPRARRYADVLGRLVGALSLTGWFSGTIAQAGMQIAQAQGDAEALLAAAQTYADAALQPLFLESPLFDRVELSSPDRPAAYTCALRQTLAEYYETGERFALLRSDPRFQALVAALRNGEAPCDT